jgi:hypothetical protein
MQVMPAAEKWVHDKLVSDGTRLREVREDLLRKEREGRQRWFQGPQGCDLFLWYREASGVVHIQLTFLQRAVEWTEAEGVRTGRLVSFDPRHPDQDQSRLIFDRSPDGETLRLSRALLERANVDEITLALVRARLGLK